MRLEELHALDDFRRQFNAPNFGHDEATEIAAKHRLTGDATRNFSASHLVFAFDSAWLKLYPPFAEDSFNAELLALNAWDGKLPVTTPKLLGSGHYGTWSYLINSHVEGLSYQQIKASLTPTHKRQLADDIGALVGAIRAQGRLGVPRCCGDWHKSAVAQIQAAEKVHMDRGCSPLWAKRIAQFLSECSPLIEPLEVHSAVHADLNHAHLMFDEVSCRLRGIIDCGDAIDAPTETEFILPFLDCFRSDFALQTRAILASGLKLPWSSEQAPRGLMVLTLLSRFINFEDWFRREFELLSPSTVDEIAAFVFPNA